MKDKVIIQAEHLTKDYGENRGIFDVSLEIKEGEMLGLVGANGAGKTTLIRSIIGFTKPTSGKVSVNGLSSWENSSTIAKTIGYVPGEIGFPDLRTGISFFKSQAEFFGIKDLSYAKELIDDLQLDPRANLKRMSKGMKQKTALIAAIMHNPPILIMDEPTTGLDPLMRETFLDIVKKQHQAGKTILMSTNTFQEIEDTCDRVALINEGKIVDIVSLDIINNRPVRDFKIEFTNRKDFEDFQREGFNIIRVQKQYNQATISIKKDQINNLMDILTKYQVKFISEVKFTLEKYFDQVMSKLKKEGHA